MSNQEISDAHGCEHAELLDFHAPATRFHTMLFRVKLEGFFTCTTSWNIALRQMPRSYFDALW